jgi:protein-arginine kinase activator protein McsA
MNEYGLNYEYFQKKLEIIVRDARTYAPGEMARVLARLSKTAHSNVILTEPEFNTPENIHKNDKFFSHDEAAATEDKIKKLKERLEITESVIISKGKSRDEARGIVVTWDTMLMESYEIAAGLKTEIKELEGE